MKCLLIVLCSSVFIQAMERQPGAHQELLKKANFLDVAVLFRTLNIDLSNKKVLDMYCSNGFNTASMVRLVGGGHIVGIEQNEAMTAQAKQSYKKLSNVSFFGLKALETFKILDDTNKFDVITLFNSLHLSENRIEKCQDIHILLKSKGHFLVNIGSGEEPLDITATREIINNNYLLRSIASAFGIEAIFADSYLKEDGVMDFFNKHGFTLLNSTTINKELLFNSDEDFIEYKRPAIMNSSSMKRIPTVSMQNWIFNTLIAQLLTKLKKNDKGQLVYPVKEIFMLLQKIKKDQCAPYTLFLK